MCKNTGLVFVTVQGLSYAFVMTTFTFSCINTAIANTYHLIKNIASCQNAPPKKTQFYCHRTVGIRVCIVCVCVRVCVCVCDRFRKRQRALLGQVEL